MYVGLLVSRGRSTGLDSSFGADGFGDGVYVGLLVSRGRSTGVASSFPLDCFSGAFGLRTILGLFTGFASFDCSLSLLSHHETSFPLFRMGVDTGIASFSSPLPFRMVVACVSEEGEGIGLERTSVLFPSREEPSVRIRGGVFGCVLTYTGEG